MNARRDVPVAAVLAVSVFLLAAAVMAKDPDFDMVVRDVESSFGGDRTQIPLLGLVGFFMRPAGVSGFHLAVFENIRHADQFEADTVMSRAALRGWQPMVRVRSTRNDENTLIYAKPAGKWIKMLIVTVEREEATVVQLSLRPDRVVEWLDTPDAIGHRARAAGQ